MDMRQLDLATKFDGLLAWDSFFHLARDDQRRMFTLFRRHARPQAALMFTSGPADGVAIGSFEGQPLFHASLAPEEYRRLLQVNGFRVVDHVVEDPACGEERSGWRSFLVTMSRADSQNLPVSVISADAPNGVAHVIRNQQGAGLVDR